MSTSIIPDVGVALTASYIKFDIKAIRVITATNFLSDPFSFYCASQPSQKKRNR